VIFYSTAGVLASKFFRDSLQGKYLSTDFFLKIFDLVKCPLGRMFDIDMLNAM